MEKVNCPNCSNVNEVKVSSGHNKPENKGKKYFTCTNCQAFFWVENGVPVSPIAGPKKSFARPLSPAPVSGTTEFVNPPTKAPDWDAKDRRIAKEASLKAMAEFFANQGGSMSVEELIKEAQKCVDWIYDEDIPSDLPF